MKPLDRRRFEALAGYVRFPYSFLFAEELAWYEEGDEKLLGLVSLDVSDGDYVLTVLARDAVNRYRAVDVQTALETPAAATIELKARLAALVGQPPEFFHQGDETGAPVDFFTPFVPPERRSRAFERLRTEKHFSPALGLIRELAHHFRDPDGNFIEQFQSTGFDARIWELYLYALFTELGYALDRDHQRPDFHCVGPLGDFFVEATTVNPSAVSPDVNEANQQSYFDDYVPIKFGSALYSKVAKEYWKLPHVSGKPFVLAIQDFHAQGSMVHSNTGLLEYLYGLKQEVAEDGGRTTVVTTPIEHHQWEGKTIASNFFSQPGSEHISAVMANPSGTLSKFNRMGFITKFGARDFTMIRRGFAYQGGVSATQFSTTVDDSYDETWAEGLSVYHNPRALIALPEEALPEAAHHVLRNGVVMSSQPEFFPVGSQTIYLSASDGDDGPKHPERE
jgi:hypothetical protein